MTRRKIFAAIAVVATIGAVSAQNARVDAMGGCGDVITDVSTVMGWPANAIDYPDLIQVTYDGAVGPVIGIKEINRSMNAGIYYNAANVLESALYTFMVSTLAGDVTRGTVNLATADVSPIPHLLAAMELGSANLGIDVYVERAFYNSKVKTLITNIETTTKIKGRFLNPGVLASLHLDMIRIAVGASVPMAKHEYEQETSAGTTTETAKSKTGIAANAAIEADLELGGQTVLVGVRGEFLNYGGEYEDKPAGAAASSVTYAKNLMLNPELYGGIINELTAHNILLALCGSVGYTIDRTEPDNVTATAAGGITKNNEVDFEARAGLEKVWDNLKRLDKIVTRGGLTYTAGIEIDRVDGEAGGDEYHSRVRDATSRSGFGLPLGIGIVKSIFALDVQLGASALANAFKLANGLFNTAGNDFVKVTITADFGNGGSSSTTYEPMPSYTPESEPGELSDPDLGF